jgi:type II secretory pathway component GspD/PulD (secretin)
VDDRTELIVLLRPTILPRPQDAAAAVKTELSRLPGIREAKERFEQDEQDRATRADEDRAKEAQRKAEKPKRKK